MKTLDGRLLVNPVYPFDLAVGSVDAVGCCLPESEDLDWIAVRYASPTASSVRTNKESVQTGRHDRPHQCRNSRARLSPAMPPPVSRQPCLCPGVCSRACSADGATECSSCWPLAPDAINDACGDMAMTRAACDCMHAFARLSTRTPTSPKIEVSCSKRCPEDWGGRVVRMAEF